MDCSFVCLVFSWFLCYLVEMGKKLGDFVCLKKK